MIEVQFPAHPFKIEQRDDKAYIFDTQRKRWVSLTPEEWVRQNFLQYLVVTLQYPAAVIAVEREIVMGDIKKRFDIVVFKHAQPWMIVECKKMDVSLNDNVIKQILNYNIALQVSHLVITNGKQTHALHINGKQHTWIDELPAYL